MLKFQILELLDPTYNYTLSNVGWRWAKRCPTATRSVYN